jgi:CRISPR-associated protein Cas4
MDDDRPEPELTVTDLAASAYCRRLPYWRLVQPVTAPPTPLMQQGRNAHARIEARPQALDLPGLGAGERVFGLRLRSARLGLVGQLDLLVKTGTTGLPVDFKHSDGPLRPGQRVQLAAYALLVEEALRLRVESGAVYFIPRRELRLVPLGTQERDDVTRRATAIRRMVASERLPPATHVRARCGACEYRNYCGDVW